VPQATLKLLPNVDVNKTPALNEAAISQSSLIRYLPDPGGQVPGLVQKYGGWRKYFPNAMPSIVRQMHAWMDTNTHRRLAVACEGASNAANPGQSFVGLIESGVLSNITPQSKGVLMTPNYTTSTTSSNVTVTDPTTTTTQFTTVYIPSHVSVGGVILFGQYPVTPTSSTTYTIPLTDVFGNPVFPTSNVTSGGVVAQYHTVAGSAQVQVTLPNHGYSAGSTYPILVATSVGGLTLEGNQTVASILDANNFYIYADQTATSTATVSVDSGASRVIYFLAFPPNPQGLGYGIGGYGGGGYGTGSTPTATTGTPLDTNDWNLDNFGEILLLMPTDSLVDSVDGVTRTGGPLLYWSPTVGTLNAVCVAQAPPVNHGFFVAMPQRQVICYGSTFNGVLDPLLVRWCDVNNFFVWIGQVTNQAGSYRIPRGSMIVGGLQAATQCLLWTDVGMWAMQYIGPGNVSSSVYGFNEIGLGCGLVAQKAAGTILGNTYWMSQSQFFQYGGGGLAPVECPVWDVIFQNLDQNNLKKIRCGVNSQFNEIAWFYPSKTGGGEVDSYVKLNVLLGTGLGWDYGPAATLPRSSWINQSVLGAPIGADPVTRFVHQHETGNDADNQPMQSSFQTGYFILEENDLIMFLDQVRPDMRWGQYGTSPNAQVQITFYVQQWPTDVPKTYGPFTLSTAVQFVTPRFRGRLVSIKISSGDVGTFWRLGAVRYRYQPDGRFY
jgi:hypothetical protein